MEPAPWHLEGVVNLEKLGESVGQEEEFVNLIHVTYKFAGKKIDKRKSNLATTVKK